MNTHRSAPADDYDEPLAHPETRGIELIGADERRGRPRDLFFVWAAPNVSVLTLTVGATLVLLGLELWQALAVILASNLLWVLTGIVAASGPAAGTSGSVITRAIYGIHGNKVVIAFYGWFISAVFLALNWLASSFMGAQLLEMVGLSGPFAGPAAVTVVIAAVTVLVAVFGHGLILRSYTAVAIVLTVIFLTASAFILPQTDLGYRAPEPLHGVALWSAITIGFTILASTPLSYSNSPDLARYLPASTPAWRTATATALGGAIPGIVFTSLGALMATGIQDTALDAGMEHAIVGMLPMWLGPIFIVGVVLNTISLNAMTTYTASMALQAIGVPIRRIPSAIVVGVIGTTLTLYLVSSTGLLEAVNLMLQLLVLISGPTMAIFALDVLLRRNRYQGPALFDQTRNGPFWYRGGWSPAGIIAVIAGAVAAALCVTSDLYTGPLAAALGMVDLSVPASITVAAAVYAALSPRALRSAPGQSTTATIRIAGK
ncbi:purine-cytosine permease family protein [Rothia halotolerans]|uniref:purine-cytosine permease family protein n=1 Tax=Rothia halotolerans TaxID=405770 RepID=UPI00101C83EC|nr:cytosine permease [Rothia halotolerans]